MKMVALLLCFLGLVVADAITNQETVSADKVFLQRQLDILDLFLNVHQPATTNALDKAAAAFSFETQTQNSNNPNAVKRFQNAYQHGFLPRSEVFNYYNPNHLDQAIQLFDLFYFAKDYQTFFNAAAWARTNINGGLFQYAVSVAVFKRPETQGMVLFRQSETHPFAYVSGRAMLAAQLAKQLGEKDFLVQFNNTNNNANYVLPYGEPSKYPFNKQTQNQYDYENHASQYTSQNSFRAEALVSYYNEDFNLNQQYAYEQLLNPAWFTNQKYQTKGQKIGEFFFYFLQQAVARHNLERAANYILNVEPLDLHSPIPAGYNPQLIYHNGQAAPARPKYMPIANANPHFYEEFLEIDRRIADAVASKHVIAADGSKVTLSAENGAEVLGNIIQNNGDSPNSEYYAANNGYYGYLDQCKRVVASTVNPDNQYDNAPSALENDNSAHRDPAFYQCASRILNYLQRFKNTLKPYNPEQLTFPGVKIQSLKTDKLITYFDNGDIDLFNSFYYQNPKVPDDFVNRKFPENYRYIAQQLQLNSKPFTYQIQVDSDKDAEAAVQVYIGPKYNNLGQEYSLEQARQLLVEIDRFPVTLKSGPNTIQRSSQQSVRFLEPVPDSKTLYKQIKDALKQNLTYNYRPNLYKHQASFPHNLILPRGRKYGIEYLLAIVIKPDDKKASTGFPFDRIVNDADFEQAQNIYFQTVKVFYKNHDDINKVEE